MNAPRLGLLIALAGTLAATWYAAGLEDEVAESVVNVRERSARQPPVQAASLPPAGAPAKPALASSSQAASLREPLPAHAVRDLFAARSWQPPPPPAPAAEPSAPPRAPALPFRYLGRMEDGDQVVVFLMDGNRERVVRQGDEWPNYRVDEINRRGMRLTYLPLNETQRMLFGSSD
ncbi:hypothetical protein [Hydrogenophaga sp.]|uniref:hypothetical protein n=1 Tax=Hydrogenophaga sp. TaxID=1904254 RepID=UPI00262D2A9A|nr:hypothetical protein [Hydrogenophaga sp.]MDM7948587.1 hypothetical protein [Hydrogenophaga sp.]